MTTLGGVGHNIAESIQRLREPCLFITAVGQDQPGQMIISSAATAINDNNNRVNFVLRFNFVYL